MDSKKLNDLRHSCAHLLAAAILRLYPDTKLTIGPAIEDGFYYDLDFKKPVTEEDLPKIEKEMAKIFPSFTGFSHREVSEKEAKDFYKDNPYKQELIDEIVGKGEKITLYKAGDFEDLCRGGHSKNPAKEIGAFKLLSIAGAYWRGDEKNKMLTRIYGTCFPTKKELEKYLEMLEEAKRRDHRKIGEKLEIFTIRKEVGPGLILWLPNGTIIKDQIEEFAKKTEREWGYKRVSTPNITKSGLYYTSGHLPYYQKDMYPPMKGGKGEEYYLKPMNCPHHHMIYSFRKRSYKELPLRLAEYGDCYRYEASGELFGLMRVRGMTQNDAHIYCTIDQAVDEFAKVMELHEYYYKIFGIKEYHLEMSLRDPKNKDKYHGDEKMWELAEKLMRKAVVKTKIPMVEQIGNAAFYGPKIDFIVKSSIGREFAVSTNQIDLYMGERFGLKYIDSDGSEKTPVIIHRAPLGSHERFIGFLIEHFGGAFPLWLSPVQVIILPIADRHVEYVKKIAGKLLETGIRVEIDERSERLDAKIRDATLQKIPYLAIIGDKEIENKDLGLTIRDRDGKDLGILSLSQFLVKLEEEVDKKV
ncbi:MAG: Threonine-tRNA ligase [Candidatus Levybacteria bacterium GW2011_GWA2_40_8]|nr:MAG: Threonine-tRNA ligase [Candidatus Levybacteria bacterium GW2011_GWA2_40_8]